jgi:peptidoglycan/xylan/chitin deacetylase (PgdA/CDA1 family)
MFSVMPSLTSVHAETNLYLNDKKIIIPILTYHHISTDKDAWSSVTISPEKFKEDMIALKEEGYTPIHFKDYMDYKEGKGALPKNPILITFDDGYYSNYEYAYPVLEEMNMKATIFVIGWSIGRSTFIDSDKPILPHFTWDQAKEMYDSGLIDIQGHTYDLHSPKGVSYAYKTPCGQGVDRIAGESTSDYKKRLIEDSTKIINLIETNIGNEVVAYAYPYGVYTKESEEVLKDLGVHFTVITVEGISLIDKHYLLDRINMPHFTSSEDLIDLISDYHGDGINYKADSDFSVLNLWSNYLSKGLDTYSDFSGFILWEINLLKQFIDMIKTNV